jgi:hypothetical protein
MNDTQTLLNELVGPIDEAAAFETLQRGMRRITRRRFATRTAAVSSCAALTIGGVVALRRDGANVSTLQPAATTQAPGASTTSAAPPTTAVATNATAVPASADGAFMIPTAAVPSDFELVAASNGLTFATPISTGTSGILVSVGADGQLITPIISIRTNPYAPNTADNVNKVPGLASVEVPTQATIPLGDASTNYMETPWSPGPDGSSTAQVHWTSGAFDVWLTGPADRELLVDIARRTTVGNDGVIVVEPPATMRWFTGNDEWVKHRAFVTYQGPGLTSVQVITAAAPAEGLEAFIIRTERDLAPLETIDGRPTQVKRGPNGVQRLQFVEGEHLVVISQSSPWAETDLSKPLPLDEAALLGTSRSLQFTQAGDWASTVRRLTPTSELEQFEGVTLVEPKPLPLTGPHGATRSATISLHRGTLEGAPFTVPILIGSGGSGSPFQSVEGAYIDGGSLRTGEDSDSAITTKTVQAGPRVVEMTVVQADGSQQPVALVEPFTDLLPGQRWGLIEYVADGAKLKVTYRDGTSELLPLF